MEVVFAGFHWQSPKVSGVTIALPTVADFSSKPAALRQYYSLVGEVQWVTFGMAGGLLGGSDSGPALTFFGSKFHGANVDANAALVWGFSPGGDMLFYTTDGRAGWFCHEDGHLHLLGTIEVAIDWVYGELLANRRPEYDYNWK
jgi:hypothetical protein